MRDFGTPAGADFTSLVTPRDGHFRLESGHHSRLWLDLDGLFVEPARVAPLVARLADQLRVFEIDAVCGPLVGGAFLAQLLAADLDASFAFTERVPPPGGEGLYRVLYRLPRALRERLRGMRVAIVDDVISAGSAVRGTHAALTAHGAQVTAIGALLALGPRASDFFAHVGVPVAAVERRPYDLWQPAQCPLCAAGVPLEDIATSGPPA